MKSIPFIDLHSHSNRHEEGIVSIKNIFPGEGFAAFTGRNFYSMGLHPWHIKSREENNEMLGMIEDAMEFDHICFIGECGLDKIASTDFEEQKRVFRAQAFMAEEFKKPLIIHCVKAYNEILEFHKEYHPAMPWIMHGYNGSLEQTVQMADKGILFSFGINLYRPNSKAVEAFRHLPLEKIFFETDENEGNVESMYEKGAELKNIPIENLAEAVWNNFSRIENNLLSRF